MVEITPSITSIIKPQKASTSNPPRTTSRISAPILPNVPLVPNLTPGGILAGLLAAVGFAHIYHSITKQIEEGIFSFFNMNNVFLTIAYTVGSFFTYNHTKAPTNLFEIDVINTAIKDFVKNLRSTMKENKSFLKILEERFIDNITYSMNGIIKEASNLLKTELEVRGHNCSDIYERDPNIHPLAKLYKEIFSEESGPENKAPERLKAYIEKYSGASGSAAGLLYEFSNVHGDIENSIMQTLIGIGSKDGSKKGTAQDHIDSIRSQINQILGPNGVALLPIKYNLESRTIDLHFVFQKDGYTKGNTSPNPKLYTGGISISLPQAYFVLLAEKLKTNINVIRESTIAKQILSKGISNISGEDLKKLNREILSKVGLFTNIVNDMRVANGTCVVYDPTIETGEFTPTPLGPIGNILNSTVTSEIVAANKEIPGFIGGASIILLSGSAGLPKNQREEDEYSYARKGHSESSGGGYDELNDNTASNTSNKSRAEIKERERINKMLSDVLGLNKGLGVVLHREGNTSLTELKLSLIAMHIRFLTNKFASKEKSEISLRNTFLDMHKSEIEAEKNKIVGEIRERKDQVMNSEDIDNEIDARLERFTENLIESKFEKERDAGQIKVMNDINSIELPQNRKDELDEMYANMAETLSQAVEESLPGNEHLGKGQKGLKLREAGNIARRYSIRDFLLVALEAALSRNKKGETLKIDGANILISSPNSTERSISNNTQLFYELAHSTPEKTTSQAMTCLEKLFRVLDKDHAKVLRERMNEIKDEVIRLSNEAKRQKLGGNGVSMDTSANNSLVVKKT